MWTQQYIGELQHCTFAGEAACDTLRLLLYKTYVGPWIRLRDVTMSSLRSVAALPFAVSIPAFSTFRDNMTLDDLGVRISCSSMYISPILSLLSCSRLPLSVRTHQINRILNILP